MATEAKINDGGPAFPSEWDTQLGMNLRDWFAGQALVGLLAHAQGDGSDFIHELGCDAAAYQSYRFADAMLKTRRGEA